MPCIVTMDLVVYCEYVLKFFREMYNQEEEITRITEVRSYHLQKEFIFG